MAAGVEKVVQLTRTTRDEVIAALRALQSAGAVASGKGTFGEWLDAWLTEVETSTRPKTLESYESVVRLHLKPIIGQKKLAKLEPKDISAAVLAVKRADLSTTTQAYVRTVARIALERALLLGKVTRNVAKLSPPVSIERSERRPFSDAEFAAFMKAIDGDRLEALYVLAIIMGPRKGELLGLQWSDIVETEDGGAYIRIVRQLQRVGKKLRIATVKTRKGARVINVPTEIADRLRQHRTQQLEERMRAGERWQEAGFVFTTKIGTPIDPRNLLEDFYRKQEKAGIYDPQKAATKTHRRPFHALRHEAATAMLAQGVDIKAIRDLLGHSSERFTHETYTHLVPALSDRVTQAARERVRKKE